LGACGAPSEGCVTPLGTAGHCRNCNEVCSGAVPYCTSEGCSGHLDIGVVGTAVSASTSFNGGSPPKFSATHTLTNSKAAGRSRIVILGLTATEPFGTTMKTVTYSGGSNTLMHLAVEAKTSESPGSYAAIYYLLDDELPANAGTYTVTVQLSPSNQSGGGSFVVSEFQNVRQTPTTPNPFVTTATSANDANCGSPTVRSIALNFSQAGSFGYAVIGARQGSNPMVVAGTVTETMNRQQPEPGPMSALAGYVGPINGNSTPSWNVSGCSNSAAVGVVLKRVGD
jgi:hypothetical protein